MKLLAQLLAVETVLAMALLPVAAHAEARAPVMAAQPARVRYPALDRILKQLAREAEAKRLVATR